MEWPLAFVATCDLVALVRGRAMSRQSLLSSNTGVGWVPADLALTAFGGIADPNPFGSLGDLRLIPDLETEIILPPADSASNPLHLFLSNQSTIDGQPWECDPRAHLQSAIQELKSRHNIEVIASFEHEFTLATSKVGNPFGLDSLRNAEPFGTKLLTTLDSVGLAPENWLPEYGNGQFEITLEPASALVAADRAVYLREIVRDTAKQEGLKASFVPLPHPEGVGNGVHIHLSLQRDGKPITYDPQTKHHLSSLASQAFNGILQHAEALLAITAPSQISFLRLTPHRWSAGGICIGKQNREALLRICPIIEFGGSDPARTFNVEYRAADATANPWLALSVLIRAMTWGLDQAQEVGEIIDGEVEGSKARPLPTSLDAAITALQTNQIVNSWFAPDLLNTHLGIRAGEKVALAGITDAEKCERYANVY